MQYNKNNNKAKKQGKQKDTPADFATFPLTGGKKDPKSGTVIPSEESVLAAKSFVDDNKK